MINNAQNEAIEANYEIDQLQNRMIIANSEADKELRAEVDAVEAEVDVVQAIVDEQQVSEVASAPTASSMAEAEAGVMAGAEPETSSAEPPKLDEKTRAAIKAELRVAQREDSDMNTPELTKKITSEFVDKLNDALKD